MKRDTHYFDSIDLHVFQLSGRDVPAYNTFTHPMFHAFYQFAMPEIPVFEIHVIVLTVVTEDRTAMHPGTW